MNRLELAERADGLRCRCSWIEGVQRTKNGNEGSVQKAQSLGEEGGAGGGTITKEKHEKHATKSKWLKLLFQDIRLVASAECSSFPGQSSVSRLSSVSSRELQETEFVYQCCGEQKISSPSDSWKGGEGGSGVLIGLRRMAESKEEKEVVMVMMKNMWDAV